MHDFTHAYNPYMHDIYMQHVGMTNDQGGFSSTFGVNGTDRGNIPTEKMRACDRT